MATLTNAQIEQKKQQLAEKKKEMKAIYDELAEAGAIEISDDDLDQVAGGYSLDPYHQRKVNYPFFR
jgi:hypothetical protein